MIISQMEIRLSAGIARLQQDLNNARQAVNGTMDRISASVAGAMKMFAGLAAGLSVAALAGFVKSSIDAIDALNDLSARTKVAIEDLAGLAYGAKLSDTSLEGVAASITKLAQNIGKDGAKFRELGITATEPLEAFKQLADVFKDIKDPQQRAAFGAEALGKSWQEAAVLLDTGADGIAALIDQGKELSGITDQVAADAGAFNDKLDELGFAAQGVGTRIAAGLLPTLQKIADSFSANSVNGSELANTVTVLSATLKGLYSVGIGVSALFVGLGKSIGGTAAVAVAALSGDFTGALATYKAIAADVYTGLGDAAIQISKLWVDTGKDTIEAVTSWSDAASDSSAKVAGFLNSSEIKGARDKAAASAASAAAKEQSAYAGLIASIKEKMAASRAEIAGAGPLTAAQQTRIKLDEELVAGKIILTDKHLKEVRALIENAEALEKNAGAAKQVREAVAALGDERDKNYESLVAEAVANEKLVETFGKTKNQIEMMTLARDEDRLAQRASLELDEKAVAQLEREIEARRRNIAAMGNLDSLEASKKANEEMVAEYKKTVDKYDDVFRTGFADMLNGGKSSWKSFTTSLLTTFKTTVADQIYRMFAQPFVIRMVGSLLGITGAGTAQAAGGALGMGGAGGAGSAASLLNAGKTIYEGFTTGFAGAAATLGGYVSSLGTMFGSTAIQGFGMGLGSAGTSAAGQAYLAQNVAGYSTGVAAAPWVAGAAGAVGGIYGGRAISGQYGSNSTVNTGTAIGAVIGSIVPGLGTALGALVGGLLGGVTNRLFGMGEKKVVSTMIDGMLTPTGATASNVSSWSQKGGLFRSNKSGTDTTALSGEQTAVFATAYKGILDLSKTFGDALGVETAALSTRMQKLSIDFKGLTTDAEKGAAVTKFFEGVANTVAAELVPSIAKFALEGEAASATLQRLAVNYRNVDDIFSAIGAKIKQTGLAGIEMREGLIAAAGGLDALAAGVGYVQQNFISEADRLVQAQKQLADGLSVIGYSALKTKDDFKAAVQGFDWSREGAAGLFVQLLALAPAFKEVTDATEAAAQVAREQVTALAQVNAGYQDQIDALLAARQGQAAVRALEIKGMDSSTVALYDRLAALKAEEVATEALSKGLLSAVDTAFTGVTASVNAQKKVLESANKAVMDAMQAQIDKTSASVTKLKSLSDTLNGALSSLREQSTNPVDDRASGQAQIAAALAIARASGVLPDADALKGALAALAKDVSDQFASDTDYQRSNYQSAMLVSDLAALTDDQLSVEQRMLDSLVGQKDLAMLAYDAEVARLDGMLETAKQQIDLLNGINIGVASIPAALSALAAALGKAQANPTNGGSAVTAMFQNLLGRAPKDSGLEFWTGALGAGTSSLADIQKQILASDEYKKLHPPGFVAGGDHEGGWRMVGESGPELEATGPARIFNAGQTRSMLGGADNGELLAELREQRRQNAEMRRMLESHLYAIAKNTLNTADALDGAINGEKPIATKEAESA